MIEQSYSEFSAKVHRAMAGRRLPVQGTFEITRRCPLRCAHCYNNLPVDHAARGRELTVEEHRRILGELAASGCFWLLYTGGEIFARPDFLDIYETARDLGFLITLFTNGTAINPRIADRLARRRPFAIEITLYGRTRETYERLTGVPGSWERCLRGIELLAGRGLPLALKTVATAINRHEIPAMQAFAESMGVPFKFDGLINPRLDCSTGPLGMRLRPEEIVSLDLADVRRVAEWRKQDARLHGPGTDPDRLYQCGGGVNSFSVDPEGGMSLCALSEREKWDLRRGSFQEGWDQFLGEIRGRAARRAGKCRECGIRAMCGMCPAQGELETGDPEQPVDFLCHVAHLRAAALGIPVEPHGACEYCAGGAHHDRLLHSLDALHGRHAANPFRILAA